MSNNPAEQYKPNLDPKLSLGQHNPDSSKTCPIHDVPTSACMNCVVNGTGTQPQSREQTKATVGDSTQNQPTGKLTLKEIQDNTHTFTLETPPNQGTVRIGAHDALEHASGNTTVPMSSGPKEAKHWMEGREIDNNDRRWANLPDEEAKPADTNTTCEECGHVDTCSYCGHVHHKGIPKFEATAVSPDTREQLTKIHPEHVTYDEAKRLFGTPSKSSSQTTCSCRHTVFRHQGNCLECKCTSYQSISSSTQSAPSKSTDAEYNHYLGIDYALQNDPAFRREYIRKHEAPTSSDGQGVSEDTMPLDEITSILIEYGEACYDHSGNTTHRRVAKERIQSLLSSEKVKELKALLGNTISSKRYDLKATPHRIIEQRIKELEDGA